MTSYRWRRFLRTSVGATLAVTIHNTTPSPYRGYVEFASPSLQLSAAAATAATHLPTQYLTNIAHLPTSTHAQTASNLPLPKIQQFPHPTSNIHHISHQTSPLCVLRVLCGSNHFLTSPPPNRPISHPNNRPPNKIFPRVLHNILLPGTTNQGINTKPYVQNYVSE